MEKIQFPHILIYNSSAGSGKTHQLAMQYLHLLLFRQEDVKHNINNILAITFTNKSSQQMRTRIIEWMKRIILDLNINDKNEKKIISELKSEIVLNEKKYRNIALSDHEIRATIHRTINYLFKNYSDFKVSTIDSFVTLILKASAFKLGISPDFEITMNIDPYIDSTIDKIFQDILDDPQIKDIFDEFIENYTFIRQEKINWFPKDFIRDNIKDIWKQIRQTGKNFYSSEEYKTTAKKEMELNVKKNIRNFCLNLQKEIDEKKIIFNKNFLNGIEEFLKKEDPLRFKNYVKKDLSSILNKNSEQPSDALCRQWNENKQKITQYYTFISEYYYLHLIKIFQIFENRLISDVRYKGGMILIQELNNLLIDILKRAETDPEFLPELYYYLSTRYYHFLIDEFQDTNFLQWKNLKILIDESLSKGGSMFIVGDKKQAIYNWRGASSGLIDRAEEGLNIENIYRNTLDINYRSRPDIIRFNNKIFDTDNIIKNFISLNEHFNKESKEKVIHDYSNSQQKDPTRKDPGKNIQGGYVYVKKIINKDLIKEEIQEKIKDEFLEIIKKIRSRDVFQDKDICVLCRKNDEVDMVVNWLLQNKISVEADITVDIRNNPLIKEIINLLQFLNEPENNFAFVNFISGDIFHKITAQKMTESYQKHLITDTKEEVVLYKKFIEEYPKIWEDYFKQSFNLIGYLPPYEFTLVLLKKWDLFNNFKEFVPYFLKLLEVIKHVENLGDNSIHSLLDYFTEDNTADEIFLLNTGEGINAVKVMTTHKSKGLEFPVVILPFTNIKNYRNNNMYFTEGEDHLKIYYINKDYTLFSPVLEQIYYNTVGKELTEELNNLYVSFTRAKNELYILLPGSKAVSNKVVDLIYNNISGLKEFIKDDIIEVGSQEKIKKERIEEAEEESPEYNNFKGELQWVEKLRTKVNEPEGITREKFYAILRGKTIHHILSKVETFPDENLGIKTDQSLHKFDLDKNIQIADDIRKLLKTNFKNKEFKQFFTLEQDDRVHNEKEIIKSGGEMRVVDRFIIRKEKIEVIDFKTGEEDKEKHVKQITEYTHLLEEIYPDKKIEGYLCYLDEKIIKEVVMSG